MPGRCKPNCHARTVRPPILAKSTAASTNIASWTTVSAISRPPGSLEELMLTPSTAAGMSTAKPPSAASSSPARSAAGAVHHGQSAAGSLGPGGPGGSRTGR